MFVQLIKKNGHWWLTNPSISHSPRPSKDFELPGLVNLQKAIENGPFIDGLPIKNGDFPWQNVSSPEGISYLTVSKCAILIPDDKYPAYILHICVVFMFPIGPATASCDSHQPQLSRRGQSGPREFAGGVKCQRGSNVACSPCMCCLCWSWWYVILTQY